MIFYLKQCKGQPSGAEMLVPQISTQLPTVQRCKLREVANSSKVEYLKILEDAPAIVAFIVVASRFFFQSHCAIKTVR